MGRGRGLRPVPRARRRGLPRRSAGTTGSAFVVEAGDFVGELGMLMGQPAFLAGVAMADTTLLRVRVQGPAAAHGDLHGTERRVAVRVRCPAAAADPSRARVASSSPATTIATCIGCRSSPSAITCPIGRCCARTRPRGPRSRRRVRSRSTGTAVVAGRGRVLTRADDARAGRCRRTRPLRAARPGAMRSADRRRRAGGPGRRRLRSLRRARCRARRGRRPGRAGGHVVADRELPRLPPRDRRRRAGPVGDAAGGQVRGTARLASVGDRAVARPGRVPGPAR